MSSHVRAFVWEGKLEVEEGVWKLMLPCHPRLPRGWHLPLHLPQREQLYALLQQIYYLLSRGESTEKPV